MKYPLHELIDRYTILRMHPRTDGRETVLEQMRRDIELRAEAESLHWIDALSLVNSKIWALESEVRATNGALGLEEIGKRTVTIRKLNNVRCALKREIAEAHNEYYPT